MMVHTTLAIALSALAVLGLRGQARDTARQSGPGAITGRVVADGDGRPLSLAHVIAISEATGDRWATTTDAEGTFAFRDVPPGEYRVGAGKPPYLAHAAGARRPGSPGSPVRVLGGALASTGDIRMMLSGTITGAVRLADGAPASQFVVTAVATRVIEGRRLPGRGASYTTRTNRHGEFRLSGLSPGQYVVAAAWDPESGPLPVPRASATDIDRALRQEFTIPSMSEALGASIIRYAYTYSPATVDVGQARLVRIGAGTTASGVVIQLHERRASRVSGVVTDRDGRPVQAAIRASLHRAPAALATVRTVQATAGVFTIDNLDPGQYELTANASDRGGKAALMVTLDGTAPVDVVLRVDSDLKLAGTLTVPAPSPVPDLVVRRVDATEDDSRLFVEGDRFQSSALMPGRYVITSPALARVLLDGKDVTDKSIDLTSPIGSSRIEVAWSESWQQVSGRITNATGGSVNSYTVVLFPTDSSYWLYRSRRILIADADADGRFSFGGPTAEFLPAGTYHLALVTELADDEQYDSEFLRALVPSAVGITLEIGARRVQDLRVK